MKKLALATAATLALALAACSGSEEPAAPTEVNETNMSEMIVNDLVAPTEIGNVAEETNLSTPEPAPMPTADEAQVIDDADATGMTSRVDRSEPGNEQ